MNRAVIPITTVVLGAAALVALSWRRPAAAAPPDPSASAAGAASAAVDPSASADAPPAAPRKPARFLPGFTKDAAPSPKPTPDEWKTAAPLELSRPHAACTGARVREYVRVTCLQERGKEQLFAARVAAGSDEGVFLLDPKWEPPRPREKLGIDVVIPVRVGDRRAIALTSVIPRWKSPTPDEGVYSIISESWLAGEDGPTITVH